MDTSHDLPHSRGRSNHGRGEKSRKLRRLAGVTLSVVEGVEPAAEILSGANGSRKSLFLKDFTCKSFGFKDRSKKFPPSP